MHTVLLLHLAPSPPPLPTYGLRTISALRLAQMTDKAISWKPGVNNDGGAPGASGSGGDSGAADDGPHTV